MTKRKPVARIVFENYRDEFVIMADAPVEVLVVDHTWESDKPRRVLHRPCVQPMGVTRAFEKLREKKSHGKRCPACKHSIPLCICQRVDEE
jgi:hypothetical protein